MTHTVRYEMVWFYRERWVSIFDRSVFSYHARSTFCYKRRHVEKWIPYISPKNFRSSKLLNIPWLVRNPFVHLLYFSIVERLYLYSEWCLFCYLSWIIFEGYLSKYFSTAFRDLHFLFFFFSFIFWWKITRLEFQKSILICTYICISVSRKS